MANYNPKILVSIIIPTYNSVATIDIALKSIFEQTFKNFEVLVMDGMSSDSTLEVVLKYKDKFPKIIVTSKKDKGIYDAMNQGIKIAKGNWLYFMGSDDSFYSSKVLENIVEKIKENNNQDVLYGNVVSSRFNGVYDGEFTYSKLMGKNICHQAIFLNENVFKKTGKFDLKYKVLADWDHNIRWFFSSKIAHKHIDIIIANYADGGFSSLNEDVAFQKDKNYKFLKLGIGKLSWYELICVCNNIVNDKSSKHNFFYITFIYFIRIIFKVMNKFFVKKK